MHMALVRQFKTNSCYSVPKSICPLGCIELSKRFSIQISFLETKTSSCLSSSLFYHPSIFSFAIYFSFSLNKISKEVKARMGLMSQ